MPGGLVPLAASLQEQGEFPAAVAQDLAAVRGGQSVEQALCSPGAPPPAMKAGCGNHVRWRRVRGLVTVAEQFAKVDGEQGHGDDIVAVVFQHLSEDAPVAGAQVTEVALGDLARGDVFLPVDAEDPLLDGPQLGILEAMADQPAGGMQEIEVGDVLERIREPVQDESGRQDARIEGLAVVAHEKAFPAGHIGQKAQRCRLLDEIPGHDEVGDKAVVFEPPESYEEGERPRAACKPGRLDIEKKTVSGRQTFQPWIGRKEGEEPHVGLFELAQGPGSPRPGEVEFLGRDKDRSERSGNLHAFRDQGQIESSGFLLLLADCRSLGPPLQDLSNSRPQLADLLVPLVMVRSGGICLARHAP